MSYKLEFDPRALKEWKKLDSSIKDQFKKKIAHILINPFVEKNKLRGFKDCYKIKIRQAGFRLVYQVQTHKVTVLVIAIGQREKSKVYTEVHKRT